MLPRHCHPLNSQWSFRIFAPPCADACAVFRVFAPLSPSAARCSGAADALWAWPQFGMVVPHRSQARLRRSLPHWAYYALFRPQGARFVRPSRLQPLCGLRLRTALRFVCSPLQPFGPPMCASSLAALPASLGSSAAIAPSIRNGRPAAPYGLQYSRLCYYIRAPRPRQPVAARDNSLPKLYNGKAMA